MRIDCPHCGLRSIEEFTIRSEVPGDRPEPDAGFDAFYDFVHVRKSPKGRNSEYWHHSGGCRALLVVERDTVTHEIFSVTGVREEG